MPLAMKFGEDLDMSGFCARGEDRDDDDDVGEDKGDVLMGEPRTASSSRCNAAFFSRSRCNCAFKTKMSSFTSEDATPLPGVDLGDVWLALLTVTRARLLTALRP